MDGTRTAGWCASPDLPTSPHISPHLALQVLVRLALEELAASGRFDFVVLQATMASVSFYEEMGFVRVGAVARYASEGTPLDALPLQGYRHWASADESQLEQFGDISYMMALKLLGTCSEPSRNSAAGRA